MELSSSLDISDLITSYHRDTKASRTRRNKSTFILVIILFIVWLLLYLIIKQVWENSTLMKQSLSLRESITQAHLDYNGLESHYDLTKKQATKVEELNQDWYDQFNRAKNEYEAGKAKAYELETASNVWTKQWNYANNLLKKARNDYEISCSEHDLSKKNWAVIQDNYKAFIQDYKSLKQLYKEVTGKEYTSEKQQWEE